MALRFRRSIKLAPGVRMNLSGSGVSWSLGPRGASIGIGKRGSYLNSGIPGTGLYARERISASGSRSEGGQQSNIVNMALTVGVNDSGDIYFKDSNGNPVSDRIVTIAKKQKEDLIKKLIQEKCDEINEQVEALGRLHWHTPNANKPPSYEIPKFPESSPLQPAPDRIGWFAKLFSGIRRKVELRNQQREIEYSKTLQERGVRKVMYERREQAHWKLVNEDIYRDINAMSQYLEMQLNEIVWPRETQVSFDISQDGGTIMVDVDLPEHEDMPTKLASVPQRGYRLSVKELGEKKVRQLYVDHIHAIGFRLIGEIFAALPTARTVVLSGYSQRPNSATGQIQDDYLYSVRIERSEWLKINLGGLETINVVDAIGRLECRREMSKTGLIKPIAPYSA